MRLGQRLAGRTALLSVGHLMRQEYSGRPARRDPDRLPTVYVDAEGTGALSGLSAVASAYSTVIRRKFVAPRPST